jgi:hypothetical protein
LAADNAAGVRAAVHRIVYTPGWHIVRLRVLRAGRLVADVGGPYVVAPVSGRLVWRGRTVGTYVMSVQDDVGYVKLVTRFIGVPVDLYRNGSILMGTLRPAPSTINADGSLKIGDGTYYVERLKVGAFPVGALRVALFIPAPPPVVSETSCRLVRVSAWRSIAAHLAARVAPLSAHYQDLVDLIRGVTGGPVAVYAGSARVAGSQLPKIPSGGVVTYGGRRWSVVSLQPASAVHVVFMAPPG